MRVGGLKSLAGGFANALGPLLEPAVKAANMAKLPTLGNLVTSGR